MKLQAIVGDSNKLYNPNPIDFVIIPHDMYTKEVACDAIHCAQDILERVKEFVEVHEWEYVLTLSWESCLTDKRTRDDFVWFVMICELFNRIEPVEKL